MAVAVRSRSRVLVEALTGAAAPTDVLRAVRGRGALLLEDGTASGWSYLVPRPRAVLERHDPAGAFAAARALLDRAGVGPPRGCPAVLGRHRGIVRLRPRARARGSARDRAGRPRASRCFGCIWSTSCSRSTTSAGSCSRVRRAPPAFDGSRRCTSRRARSPLSSPEGVSSTSSHMPTTDRSQSACSSTSIAGTCTRRTSRTACPAAAARPSSSTPSCEGRRPSRTTCTSTAGRSSSPGPVPRRSCGPIRTARSRAGRSREPLRARMTPPQTARLRLRLP